MKTIVLVCALLTVQFSLAIRTKIRTSKERDVNNGDVRTDLFVRFPVVRCINIIILLYFFFSSLFLVYKLCVSIFTVLYLLCNLLLSC